MFNTANHQRSADQSHTEILPHICQDDIKKNLPKLARLWRKQNPCMLLVRMVIGTAIMENTMKIAPKIKSRATIGSSNSIPQYMRRENENTNSKTYMNPNVHSSIVYNSLGMKAIEESINKQEDREDV